jgi:hypothetical protein
MAEAGPALSEVRLIQELFIGRSAWSAAQMEMMR